MQFNIWITYNINDPPEGLSDFDAEMVTLPSAFTHDKAIFVHWPSSTEMVVVTDRPQSSTIRLLAIDKRNGPRLVSKVIMSLLVLEVVGICEKMYKFESVSECAHSVIFFLFLISFLF